MIYNLKNSGATNYSSNSRNNLTYLFSYLHPFTAVWKGKRWESKKKSETHKEKIHFLDFIICDYSGTSMLLLFFLNLKIIIVWQHIHDPAAKSQLFKRSLASV